MANGIAVLVLTVLAAGAMLWQRQQTQRRQAAARAPAVNPWHCVSIRCAADACRAAQALNGQRHLSAMAPRLPLPGCDARQCRCGYQHFQDRRHQEDRRMPYGNSAAKARVAEDPSRERRRGDDRRQSPATFVALNEELRNSLRRKPERRTA